MMLVSKFCHYYITHKNAQLYTVYHLTVVDCAKEVDENKHFV